MFTEDFSRAPVQGRAAALVIAEGRCAAGRRDGVTWRRRLRDGSIRAELVLFSSVAAAEAAARAHRGRVRLLVAEPRGYTNGVWRAEDGGMAHNERFHPVSTELRDGREPPEIAGPVRRPRRERRRPEPRRWTIFDGESMFLGATRYRHPLAWLATNRHWWPMVAKMHRMPGTVWHGVYAEWPFTLGTLATYRTRDDMMRFARMPEHRHLMQWIVRDTVNATGGFIRIFSSHGELARQASAAAQASARVRADGPGGDDGERLRLERVETEAQLQEFLAVSRRGDPAHLAVPLLEDVVRAWFDGSAAADGRTELLLARRGDETVGRTTIHADRALDEKLGTRATLFGATWAATPDDLRALLELIADRGRRDGSAEVIGPVSLLPNQTGGVITSGFDEPGFFDGAWNPDWVPRVYEEAGFAVWNASDTWIADLDAAPAPSAPSAEELAAAGIRIRRASRVRFARDVARLRTLVNAAFAQLPYYTEISRAQMRDATSGLVGLMDPGLWVFAEDARTGEPVGFVLVVPDPVDVLRGSGGRVGPREALRLLRGGRGRDAVLVIHGVVPERQGRGIAGLLWRAVAERLREGGYRTLRTTYIGRENAASARPIERLGGRPLHGTAFYRRRLEES
ncbi:GNAT family N-acetyltransferase [Microbacterium barkeri]|uniref:GNAT family N-acetyltransferase n=1 Tax=Microbacterium barkeri TaxID=33917 RepID=UPI0024AF1166|nr:GNAT family N-acetyltransferase [Microbacterium barkeri]MDI6944858.1 GNAT family N-acetyltransferase [Microbacterium barkeri]